MTIDSSVRDAINYTILQDAEDAAYAAEYQRWVDTLSPEEKNHLEELGISSPLLPNFNGGVWGGKADVHRSSGGGYFEGGQQVGVTNPHELVESEIDNLRDFTGLGKQAAEKVLEWLQTKRRDSAAEIQAEAADSLAKFFALLLPPLPIKKINLRILGLKSLAVCYLLNRNGTTTLTDLADRAGVSKQLLDHHVRRNEVALNFHGWGQKSIASRASYSNHAKERWAALSPEQRKARRNGQKGIVGTTNAQRTDLTTPAFL